MQSKVFHIISAMLLFLGAASMAKAQESHPTPSEEMDRIIVGVNTYKPQSSIKIAGNVYGGGDQAAVEGNTNVTINTGEYGGEIFGGGNGALNADGTVNKSADIGTLDGDANLVANTGTTKVTINGGKFLVEQVTGDPATNPEVGKLTNNHNVYGGGNLACNVFGNTEVEINAGLLPTEFFKVEGSGASATSMYRKWGEYVGRIEGMMAAKVPDTPEKLVQGSVFGAGYGVHTSVQGNTSVTIAMGDEEAINNTNDILTRYAYAKRGGDTSGKTLASKFVITAFGGGYDGTVAGNTDVQISGSPFLQNVFGGGLGSKAGAEQKNPTAAYASTVGTVNGGTNVNISGATIYGHVYGGGAGIFGEIDATTDHGTAKMPYYKAAMVMKETNLEISGGTLIFGNVYGGGDIANTGWFEEGYRPSESHQNYVNESQAHLDLTTYLQMKGGNVMGNVFAGGNGRKMTELEKSNFIGAIIGNTSVVLGKENGSSWDAGTKIWGSVYGGGQNGCVYSCAAMAANNGGKARTLATGLIDGCTNVEFKHTDIGQDIFGGGLGAVEMVDHDHNPATPEQEVITSADISGNTFVFFNRGNLITGNYWDPQDCVFKEQKCGEYVENEVKVNYRDTPSDIAHNLYGGGNMACTIGTKVSGNLAANTGSTTVYMVGAPVVDPSFMGSKYYTDALAIYGKPHFSAFGAGYGKYAKVLGNAYSDIALVAAGFHSVVGGGMNGPVEGECYTHIACNKDNTRIHNVYGGGYYAPVGGTHLQITEGYILENVFGGGVMGNIAPDNEDMAAAVASTVIGLKKEGDGSSYTLYGVDGTSVIRTYNYDGNKIIIDGNVYGGNDVSGTVNGVASLTLYGGTVRSNVHGAGNGNHVGYYVPNILKYDKGDHGDDNYFMVDHTNDNGGPKGRTYVGRPQTIGGVNLTLEGNSTTERVTVLGQVFGGGNSCTIGAWDKELLASKGDNPHVVRDDPAYFLGGGTLDINLGSHVTIGRNRAMLNDAADKEKYIDNDENVTGLFMGCSGKDLATQDGSYTKDNYYHHFYNYKAGKYYPGFAVGDEQGKDMSRLEQLKPFQAYLNNIMIWTNDIHLNIKEGAEDIWLANFVGGGFRGSMRLKTGEGRFDYQLPIGVTVNHAIVGGAYNAHVRYHLFDSDSEGYFVDSDSEGTKGYGVYDYATEIPSGWTTMEEDPEGGQYISLLYEDPAHPDQVTGILRYNYNGGMLAENSTGLNSSDISEHIHTVHADPRKTPAAYETAYFEPKAEGQDDREDETTRAKLFTANKEKTLLYLQLNCALEPEVFEADSKHDSKYANGGNVYGGCFSSGFVEGDSWVDYSCWLSPKCTDQTFFGKQNNLEIYEQVADLDRNNAMSVFGAGFGSDTHSMGDVYLRIKNIDNDALGDADPNGKFPYIYNAFGGSNMGEVDGNVNVYYDTGAQGTLLGSLYGGSYQGGIGGNTFVELASGFLFNVYGGSRKANIDGASHVWAYDGFYRGAPDANHLIVCNLYGGNDIAGTIRGTMPAAFAMDKWNGYAKRPEVTLANDQQFNTYVEISTDNEASRGFPLIGSAYAGGNGLNWTYADGEKPEVKNALIEIGGGSTLNAFGGGNMATVTGKTCIFANSEGDTYANVEFTAYQKYIVQNVFFNGMKRGYKWDNNTLIMNPFHVMNLFGGNNLATMDIQPTWNLAKGRLENVYSGGNMGDMTYYNPAGDPATEDKSPTGKSGAIADDGSNSNYNPRGLSITIEQPDIFIQSLFGGCRMSDVRPNDDDYDYADKWPEGEDYYGATVNITDGYINNIYGGNDISGHVDHGTNVNISGAVSGNVYGSGNGFYLYKFDPSVSQVTEMNDESDGGYGIYYRVPEKAADGVTLLDKRGTPGTDTHKILTINEVRPSVEKAFLNIGGLESYTDPKTNVTAKRVAYVKGNVFCGGNASTVTSDGNNDFTKFKIGSYVTLNGVFMGSDGLAFTENDEIARFAKINDIKDMGAATSFNSGYELDKQHNPILLNTYMMAVDMKAQPRDFNLNLPLKEAHIGTYCGGGNRGSMLVDKTVELPFHHDIIIYDKIVGACLNANVEYNQNGNIITSYGGYTRAIDLAKNGTNGNTKMRLNIASQFVPLMMDVPDDQLGTNLHGESFEVAKQHDFLYSNYGAAVKYTYKEYNELFQTQYTSQADFEKNEDEHNQWKVASDTYAPSCNIYGGCYQSGEVEGDIELNLYTNMLRYVNKEDLDKSIVDNIACFNVYGAGFGQNSHVWGNVKINMDRCLDTSTMGSIGESTVSTELAELLGTSSKWNIQNQTYNLTPTGLDCSYPSFNNVIGGGRNGKLIGNSTVEIRNGLVYSDVAGGCYASDMYGSTHVIVGYPQYWECNTSGEYDVQRGDTWNTTKEDVYGDKVVKQTIKYLKGDLVPNNMYEQIVAANSGNRTKFDLVTGKEPSTANGANGWDDVHIKIGKGVYGGGYSLANSTAASAGSITTHKLKADDPSIPDNEKDLHPHNFDGRPYYDKATSSYEVFAKNATIGFGGNSSIMLGDQEGGARDHIHISTLKVTALPKPYTASTKIGKYTLEDGKYNHQGDGTPDPAVQYYELSGDGGLYGDGHLTFCEGFRSADVTRYGWAEGTAQHPVLLNTFQRMDLLSVNDCCLMLQGAQDFATDQIDATIYSITRINELRMNSSLSAAGTLGQISAQNGVGGVGTDFDHTHQRNYLAFFNNVHHLGSIVTNDKFDDAEHTFHDANGSLGTMSYKAKKQEFITTYEGSLKDAAAVTAFKRRNVATARNAIGINNGYCLRIQNQEYVTTDGKKQSQTYYGPIVGVCEVKLLTLVQGEGGGYVYADNIHVDENNFLMTSGNFVFPGIVNSDPQVGDQYIVDDCFLKHYGTPSNITQKNGDLDDAHYWYVEGNKYFFNTTLTGFTYQEALDFNLIDNDPNVILSGMENGSNLNIKKIEWLSTHRDNYECVLENAETSPEKIDDYEFDIQIGGVTGTDWASDMPRHSAGSNETPLTTGKIIQNDNLPQFNVLLQDKLDNSGDAKYINHLDEPEVVKLYLEGKTKDEHDNWQTYEYTITMNIVYLQGPTFEGGVRIENCALPGEWINFSSEGLKIKTPELMPITAASWQIVPLQQIDEHGVWHWDISKGTVIPGVQENLDGNMEGHITALYKQNEYAIAYIFTAGGKNFPVMPKQTNEKKEQRMIVVHNYHRMKDVVSHNLQIETVVTAPNHSVGGEDEVYHPDLAQAKLYIEDEEDLHAFVKYLNMATATYTDAEGTHDGNEYNIPVGLTGLDIILQKDITLSKDLPEISVPFAGTFHGDGHHIDLGEYETSLFGDNLQGKVYNLGIVNGENVASTASTGDVVNSYIYDASDDNFKYGKTAYQLSHYFTPTHEGETVVADADNYVKNYYTNGDYQYATTDRVWSLRTGAPNYGQAVTRHDKSHAHDADRWNDGGDDDGDGNAVDILSEKGTNVPLYNGTMKIDDKITTDAYGDVIDKKYGLPVAYANDYLFFGQHLDKTCADAYPMHIEDVATGDPDRSKGGNRVYETAGYYHSKTNDGFYYNKDAWALQPTLTAIDYTNMTVEGDGAETLPTKFSVDSNKDYDGESNPITYDGEGNPITGTGYTNASYGHVSQNLLIYNNGEPIFDEKDIADIPEKKVTYHNLVNYGSNFATDYFHLVDKQCFNAPIEFNVTTRAWYERTPDRWRNVTKTDESYDTPSAWEGICLPFTARRIFAEENGELSHFYGAGDQTETIDDKTYNINTLHHEYWLTGFTKMEGDATAVFSRPSVVDSGLFVNDKQTAEKIDYTYPANEYFTSLVNYTDYHDKNFDESDTEGDEWIRSDAEWYLSSHEYKDYVPLTASVPYLIAFPGNDFYEFSLEGQTKDKKLGEGHKKDNNHQLVTFENTNSIMIGISDDEVKPTTVDGNDHKHVGTYMGMTSSTGATIYGLNALGSAFETKMTDPQRILPFRTYMTTSASAPQTRSILISDGYVTEIGEEPDEPSEELGENYLRIWAEGLDIVVETSQNRNLRVFTSDGVCREILECESGKNWFPMSNEGVYFIENVKIMLKK